MSVDIRKLMQVDDKGTQRQYYPETNIEAVNGLQDLLLSGDFPALEETIRQFESNVSETSGRLNRLKDEMTEMVEGEHGYLTLEKGFENYNDDERARDEATFLQYLRVGPLCYVFGTIRNTETIKAKSEIIVSNFPEKLRVNVSAGNICQGSFNNSFLAQANSEYHLNFPNQITISRTRDNGGSNTDFSSGRWLNISLVCGVKVVQ